MSKEAMKLAQAVIDAARAAMDSSFEAGNEQMDISIPAHLAAALSLCLDECDREALAEQPAQQEPVANGLPLVIAGAIFDFAGYLTTRDIVIEVGSTANASPVADLVRDWAALRGLSLADAAVLSWQEWLTDVHAIDTLQERVDEMQKHRHDTSPPAQRKPWVGLTDVEWMNIVNKDHAWFGQRPEDVAHEVAKLVEAKLREKNA